MGKANPKHYGVRFLFSFHRLYSSKGAIGRILAVVIIASIVLAAIVGGTYYYVTTTLSNIERPPTATPTATPTLAPATTPTATPTTAPIDWQIVDLIQAVWDNLVEPAISGDGLEEMDLTLKSKSNNPLEVKIQPGTMFLAQSSGVQNMVVIEEKVVHLEEYGDTVSEVIDVACACMELAMPQGTDSFTVSDTQAQEDLVKLLSLPAFADETFRAKQFAIWTITDNPPREGYVGIGYFGIGSGPKDEEMSRIKTMFENAGILTTKYQALDLVEPTPTSTATPRHTPTPTPTPIPTATPTPEPTTTPKYSLSEAMEAGYVQANITGVGLGTSSGDSIILRIKRVVEYTIEIEPVPTGTLLVASGNYQNMAVQALKGLYTVIGYYPRNEILLDTSDEVSYLFSGYCVSFNKPNPTISTRFSISGNADANVLNIYSVLSQLPANVTGIAAVQTAIFVVTDDISKSELQSTFPSGVAEIQNARTILEQAGIDVSTKKLFA
jgi:hypothetical protein